MQKARLVKHMGLQIVSMNLGVIGSAETLDFLNTAKFEHFSTIIFSFQCVYINHILLKGPYEKKDSSAMVATCVYLLP